MNAEPETKLRVLIAEDHLGTQKALKTLLERQGYEVIAVSDGSDARIQLTSVNAPNIALLDWQLPGASGIEVCQAVRSAEGGRYTYIVVITGREGVTDFSVAFAAGADDFIRKPCDPTELLARVRSGQRIVELERSCATRIVELEEALERVQQLKRLLPICTYCKRVRDDTDYWQQIEDYIHDHTGTDFSHGICPQCMQSVMEKEFPAKK